MDNIKIESYKSIDSIRDIWSAMDREALRKIRNGEMERILYTFYQTLKWNEFVERFYSKRPECKIGLKSIEYLLASRDGKPVAILPIMRNQTSGSIEMTSWRTAGVNNVITADHSDVNKDVFQSLIQYLKNHFKGKKLRFYDLPNQSTFTCMLKELPGVNVTERSSFHIPLSDFDDFDQYYASLNKKLRHNIQTRSNHFTHGDLTKELKVFTKENNPGPAYWHKIWDLFYKRRNIWRKRDINLFRKMINRFETWKECRGGMKTVSFSELEETILFVFEINNEPAAFAFLYLSDGYIVVPKLAIDTRQRAHAPGILMLKEIMKWCYDNGVKDFDLCRGEEPYKQQMGAVNQPICRINARL